jgi:hypothetical protein
MSVDITARLAEVMPGIRRDLEDLVRIQSVSADPARAAEVERSAEVFVALDDAGSDRPHAHVEPVRGTTAEMAVRLAEFADAGVEEAILVVSPITERSIRQLGDLVAAARPLK